MIVPSREAIARALCLHQCHINGGLPGEGLRRAVDAGWSNWTGFADAILALLAQQPEAQGRDRSEDRQTFEIPEGHVAVRGADGRFTGETVPEAQGGAVVAWAVERWNAEVKHRPLQNIHRRTLDDTWRQVMRHFGGDPETLVGPSHDDLLTTAPPATSGRRT